MDNNMTVKAEGYARFLIGMYNSYNTEVGEAKVMEMLDSVGFTLNGTTDFTYAELTTALNK